jgi:hypothetical protein
VCINNKIKKRQKTRPRPIWAVAALDGWIGGLRSFKLFKKGRQMKTKNFTQSNYT